MRSIVFALALVAGSAQAGMVYEWQTIRSPIELTGRMEIIGPGAFSHEYAPACPMEMCDDVDMSDPTSPVLRFSFSSAGHGASLDLDYVSGQGWMFTGPSRFDITARRLLMGSLTVGNGSDYLSMSSTGALWTIEALDSDRGPPCAPSGDSPDAFCEGATGRWVLQQQVPIPGTLALLLGALLLQVSMQRIGRRMPAPRLGLTRAT